MQRHLAYVLRVHATAFSFRMFPSISAEEGKEHLREQQAFLGQQLPKSWNAFSHTGTRRTVLLVQWQHAWCGLCCLAPNLQQQSVHEHRLP